MPVAGILLFAGWITEDESLKKLVTNLSRYSDEYRQEKIHLHLDKPYYAIGDDIWFKAYIVNGEKNELSNISKILYVDLINESDSIKKTLRLPVNAGISYGDFKLSDSLAEGNYRLRAYTTWMRNFDEDFYFDQTIKVGNSWSNEIITKATYKITEAEKKQEVNATLNFSDLSGQAYQNREVTYIVELDARQIARGKGITDNKGDLIISFTNNQPAILKSGKILATIKSQDKVIATKVFPIKSTSDEVSLQFFPEGGDMIDDVRTRVGFKAINSIGKGISVKGKIIDQNNELAAEFSSKHLGMGAFAIKPLAQNTYKAEVTFEDGSSKTFALPAVKKEGFILSVVNNFNDKDLNVRVITNEQTLQKMNGRKMTVIAQKDGVVNYTSQAVLNSLTSAASVLKTRFPAGISQVTLLDDQMQPLAERLIFIKPTQNIDIALKTDKSNFSTREKTTVSLAVLNNQKEPVTGTFSVAVTNENLVPVEENEERTIQSNLLLTNDLRGYVEQPNYYFAKNDESSYQHLDLLMMTQGWRKFVFKNIAAGVFPTLSYQPEQSISISGKLTTYGGKPVPNGKVTLFSSSGGAFLIQATADAEGSFKFDSLIFGDSTRFVIQARTGKDRKNLDIKLNNIPPQLITKNKNIAEVSVNVNQSLLTYLKNSKKQYDSWAKYGLVGRSIVLNEVKVSETKSKAPNSSNLNGAGFADAIIYAKDLQNFPYLYQSMQGRVAGLLFDGNGVPYLARNGGRLPMQIIIDGIFVDPGFLNSINAFDVETVEILKNAANTSIYGGRGAGGVMIITTKRGGGGTPVNAFTPGIVAYSPLGYYASREFYAPDYDSPKTNTNIADLRTTIFWKPNIITDDNGKATFSFFNADQPGTYKIVLEGIDLNGNLCRQVHRYQVN